MTTTDADREWARARLIAVQAMLEELRDNPSAFSSAALSGVAIRALEALASTRAEALEQACVIIAQHCGVNPRSETWAHVAKIERDVRALIATPADTEKK